MEDIGEQGVDHTLGWLSLKENYLRRQYSFFKYSIEYYLVLQ